MSADVSAPPLLEALLRRHGVTRADVEEEALQRALARCGEGGGEAEAEALLAPVVRMAATNRELQRVGMPPLLLQPGEDDDPAYPRQRLGAGEGGLRLPGGVVGPAIGEAERQALAAIQMPPDLYLLLRGDHGEVMGLRLHRDAYTKAMRVCRTRRAVALRDQPDAARAYLGEQLVRIARRTEAYIMAKKNKTKKAKKPARTGGTNDDEDAAEDDDVHGSE